MWTIEQESFDPATAKAYEGLFTQGWAWVHLRGSLEQPIPGQPQDAPYQRTAANVTSEQFRERITKWGCYLPGIFGNHPTLNTEIINLPWPLELRIAVEGIELTPAGEHSLEHRDDSKPASPDAGAHTANASSPIPRRIARDSRTLDLRTGLLTRRVRWHVAGRTLDLVFERFVSSTRNGLIVQRITARADASCNAELIAGIDARVRTNGHDHFRSVRFDARTPWLCCHVHTDADDHVHMACALRGHFTTPQPQLETRRAAWQTTMSVEPEGATVEKITLVRPDATPPPSLEALPTFDDLLAEHAHAMRCQWDLCDIEIQGDAESQLALRTALYHLIRAHPRTSSVAIDAKGYAGEAYWGRFFWDTEVFLLPFYAHTMPEQARQLCLFRVETLDGARANARRYGYSGARYAWESDHRGFECCPNWQYADHEIHVTADVVFGFLSYAQATGDDAFLTHQARPAILESARYWLTRVDRRAEDDRVHLLGVMGPDEYTLISSNNAYTNRMVALALELAARLADNVHEREQWADTARRLWIPRLGSLILQCEEWPLLAEPDFDSTWTDRSRTYAAQVSQERLYRTKCLKQADVLMLMALLPHEFSDEQLAAAWRAYVPCTTHDSSLSPGVHAQVALRLGMYDQAWEFWKQSIGLDLDVTRAGAAEGVHIAAAAALWQTAVFGFAGVKTAMQTQTLTIQPRMPAHWHSMRFPLCWRGSRVQIHIERARVTLTHLHGPPLDVVVHARPKRLEPGQQQQWSLS
ncbi:MAG: glycoside hydrolase family 65 protein [Planctomycetota bacterium]|nr:MAG: glycoside hydrolase family 65 protein [Planctomycetota bacterium]